MRSNLARPYVALVVAVAASAALAGCPPAYPNCSHDSDCHHGEYCVNGRCQLCRADADCPSGQRCASGRCDAIPGYCGGSGDCPNGQECHDHTCTQVTQSTTDLPDPNAAQATGPCGLDRVYFEFESADLPPSTRDQLTRAAQCIRDRHIPHVTIIGNCDSRGTEEYNLALGDRRARAIRDYLVSLGIDRGVLGTASHGEEFAHGSDDASYTQDRNAELATQ